MNASEQAPRAAWRHASVLAALCVAFALRLAWILNVDSEPTHDALWYVDQARNIASGLGYVVDGRPTAYWPVGYPAALALALKLGGGALIAGRIANLVFSVVSVFLIHELTWSISGSVLAARIAMWMLALYPTDIQYCSLLVSEPLFSTLVLAASVLLLGKQPTPKQLMAAGALFGIATITRVQGLPLPLLVLGLREVTKLRDIGSVLRLQLRNLTRVYASLAATLAPWVLRNFVAFGAFVLVSSNGGINFYIGNNPSSTGGYELGEATRARLFDGSISDERGGTSELATSHRAFQLAMSYVVENPAETLARWPKKLSALYAHDNTGITWNKVEKSQRASLRKLLAVTELYYRALWLLAFVGVAFAFRARTRMRSPFIPWAVVLSFTMLHVVFFGSSRFHAPMMPWIIVFSAYATAAVVGMRRAHDTHP